VKKVYGRALLKKDLPRRKKTDSKVQGGKVAAIAGSTGMWGAAVLSAQAAIRSGAGYVYLFQSNRQTLWSHPDFLTFTKSQFAKIKFSSVILGPGYRKPQDIQKWIRLFKKTKQKNVILDAEALNWLAKNPKQKLPPTWVLTPHEGEMGRLLHKSRKWVHAHREEAAKLAQKKWQCIVILKGPKTLVCEESTLYQINSGNPALGKAGSGDVLAGMIAAFLAQNQSSPLRSVCAAVFVHGWIADQWIRSQKDIVSLRPVDLIEQLPLALKTLR
jgi:ADP-dependent NAD(P)H-hydrate dehydratase